MIPVNTNMQVTPLRYSECGVTEGLIGWWELNGDLLDSSGNGNDITVTSNATVSPNKVNTQNGYMQLPWGNTYPLNSDSGLTVIIKINPISVAADKGLFGALNVGDTRFYCGLNTSLNLAMGIEEDEWNLNAHSEGLTAGEDVVVAISIRDGAAYLYKSGDYTGVSSNITGYALEGDIVVGANYVGNCAFDNLDIMEIKLFDRGLSDTEVNIETSLMMEETDLILAEDGTLYTRGVSEEL